MAKSVLSCFLCCISVGCDDFGGQKDDSNTKFSQQNTPSYTCLRDRQVSKHINIYYIFFRTFSRYSRCNFPLPDQMQCQTYFVLLAVHSVGVLSCQTTVFALIIALHSLYKLSRNIYFLPSIDSSSGTLIFSRRTNGNWSLSIWNHATHQIYFPADFMNLHAFYVLVHLGHLNCCEVTRLRSRLISVEYVTSLGFLRLYQL